MGCVAVGGWRVVGSFVRMGGDGDDGGRMFWVVSGRHSRIQSDSSHGSSLGMVGLCPGSLRVKTL